MSLPETMSAAALFSIGDFRVREAAVPRPAGVELLMRVHACGICGSDLPRVYELGTSSGIYPLTLGHEFCGTIVAAGPGADASLVGRRGAVFPLIPCRKCDACLTGNYAMCADYDYLGSRRDGGFAQYCLIPSAWHFVEADGEGVSMDALAMAEPATVAQHAVRKSGITAGETLVVFGAGPIGIMAARWAKRFGAAHVLLVDVADDKVAFARDRGLDAINSLKESVPDAVRARTGGRLADAAIEGAGAGASLTGCIECIRPFGTVVLMGNPGRDMTVPRPAYSTLLRKEATIRSIWNSYFADTPINEWRYTVKCLGDGSLEAGDLITHRVSLAQLPGLLDGIRGHRVTVCKGLYCSALD